MAERILSAMTMNFDGLHQFSYGRYPNPLLKLLAPGLTYCPRRVLKIGIGLATTVMAEYRVRHDT